MKKNKIFTSALALTLLLSGLATQNVFAAGETEGSTAIAVGVKAGTTIVPDPDPGEEEPGGNNPGSDAAFTFYYTPTKLTFKDAKFNTASQEVALDSTISGNDVNRPLVVSDQRGTGKGWAVQAQIKDGKLTGTGADTAKSITAPTVKFKHNLGKYTVTGPTAAERVWSATGHDVTGVKTEITKDKATVLKADVNKGAGYQGSKLSDIKLVIPGGQGEAGVNYAGTIDWTLLAAPQ